MLDPKEAAQLAQAIANVQRHYESVISAKTLDWSRLVMTLGTIYGSRALAIGMRRKAAAKKPPQQSPAGANVFPLGT